MSDKVDYWLNMCDEDLITAKAMLDAGRLLWVGFVCHLTVEKALKAVIEEVSGSAPPKIHNLIKLATLGGVINDLAEKQVRLLRELNPLHIETRYNEYKDKLAASLTLKRCERILLETEEFLCWTKKRLGR